MKTNFSFSYYAGPAQEYFWLTLALYGAEVIYSASLVLQGSYSAVLLPLQSNCILFFPLIFYSRYDLIWFMQRLRLRYLLHLGYFFLRYLVLKEKYSPITSGSNLLWIGNIFCSILFLSKLNDAVHLERHQRIHPLASFAISREIKHVDCLLAEAVPSSLKGTES